MGRGAIEVGTVGCEYSVDLTSFLTSAVSSVVLLIFKMRYSWIFQASALTLVVALPHDYIYAVKETHIVPDSFTRVGDVPENHRIRLSIGLKQNRYDELERQLFEGIDSVGTLKEAHLPFW